MTVTSQLPTAAPPSEKTQTRRLPVVLAAVAVACGALLVSGILQPLGIAGISLVLMLALILLGVPVGLGMLLAGAAGIWALRGEGALAAIAGDTPLAFLSSWTFSVIPSFIFMGCVLWRSGIAKRIFDAAYVLFGRLPGGLAVATNFAGAGMAATSGSTIGISYALSKMAVPEMMRLRYDKGLATGSVAMAGTLGQLIPPSILLVIYAGIAGVPVGAQLVAGFVPGVLLALAFGVLIVVRCALRPSLAPRPGADERAVMRPAERLRTVAGAWPLVALLVLIMGGIYSGVFTATEAAAAGAIGSVLLACQAVRGRELGRALFGALLDTASAFSAVALLLVGAAVLNRMFVLSGFGSWLVEQISAFGMGRVALLLVLAAVYILLGMIMEPTGMMLLTVPLLLPVLMTEQIDLIWFGIFVVILGEVAIVTPPVGVLVFVVHQAVRGLEVPGAAKVRLGEVFAGVVPFILVAFAFLGLMIAFPELIAWVPRDLG